MLLLLFIVVIFINFPGHERERSRLHSSSDFVSRKQSKVMSDLIADLKLIHV